MTDIKRCHRGYTTGARGRRHHATDSKSRTAPEPTTTAVATAQQAPVKHPSDKLWDSLKNARGKIVLSQADRQTLLAYRSEANRCLTQLRKREAQVQYFRSLASHPRPVDDREFESFNERFGPRPGAGYDQVQAQMFQMAQGANLCRMLASECRELSTQASVTLTQTEQQRARTVTPPTPTPTAAGSGGSGNALTAPATAEWRTKLLRELQETRRTLGNVRDVLRQLVSDAVRRADESEQWRRALDEQRTRSAGLTEQLCEARAELAVARRTSARADDKAGNAAAALSSCARTLGIKLPADASAHDCTELAALIAEHALELDRRSRQAADNDRLAAEAQAAVASAANSATAAARLGTDGPDTAGGEEVEKARQGDQADGGHTSTEASAPGPHVSSQNVEKEVLTYIAKKTQHGWAPIFAELMTSLGVEAGEVARLRSEILYSFGDYKVGQAYAALKRWRRAAGAKKINYDNLKVALMRNRRKDLADYIDRKTG